MPVESAPLAEAIAAGWADGSLVLPGMILCHVPHQIMEILQKIKYLHPIRRQIFPLFLPGILRDKTMNQGWQSTKKNRQILDSKLRILVFPLTEINLQFLQLVL